MQGRVLGNFRLSKPIAAGGMGAVFFARKEAFGRFSQPAAVKLVHPHFANQKDFVDMFLDEARIASCINHPNVCRVLDFGVAEGTYYLAMEYVHGETWGELLARAKDDEQKDMLPVVAAYVIAQACEGLHAAHIATGENGQPLQIVHRDVSPQNIFVAYDGTVRVIDFGVARASERLTTTRAGVVKGKLAYMAPEQINGGELDARVDVWALGVILREALEGKRLFRRDSDTETLRAVVGEPLPPWSTTVKEELAAIVDRALAKDVSQRYATAREMGLALSRFVAAQSTPLGSPELSAWMHRLFAEQFEQKRAMLLAEQPPEVEEEGRTSTPEDEAPEDEAPEDSRDEEPTRGPAKRHARPQPSLVQPTPSLRTARIQRRLGVGLVALGLLVLGLSALVVYKRTIGSKVQPRTVELVLPKAPVPQVTQIVASPPSAPMPPSADDAPAAPAPIAAAQVPSPPVASVKPKTPVARERRRATLLIASPSGWAEIYLGGKKLGTTPGKFTLSEGTHTLLVKPLGKGPGYTKKVTLGAGNNKLIL